MEHNIPVEIQTLLESYVKLLREEFGEAIFGVYIYGSLVTGCFDKESSDVDFLTVIKSSLDPEDIKRLEGVHKKLRSINSFGNMLEGEYVRYGDIIDGMPYKQYPYFAFGRFEGHVGLKSFAWFQLKERGIALYGNDFKDIAGETDWKEIRAELLERISDYWSGMADWKLLFDRWLALVVLSVCRIYYTLENKSTISKDGGGKFALSKLPEKWHILINEALRIQKKSSDRSLYRSRIKRTRDARDFVKHISEKYNAQF